ncbi:hypothetical protein LAC81_02110 [Ensifer adhaerens]|uniref:hypothetical protein n=1 Tax=Ensifer adhaerens TaxID=106592 RepID=UPI001CBE0CEF|nr:hypothetical protein [Ensifer adhaerens]MBZ7920581.1 hypothetical protein [Ensifer adhaerens]UAX93054.1 hypothetical protein LAC78_02105 [Ensifer adhaerens]UAY00690.1 hypothetical protein LAC80_02110 [Ensifer adhaerens]UAY08071.1 hypothetical protein LAC81_02110 [Ensifer adhaerens]
MTAKARLRVVPPIAVEPDEGRRLRRQAGEAGLREQVQGADNGRPHHPWRSEIYDIQMMTKIAVTLVDEVFRNIVAMEDLHEIALREQLGFDELCFQVHALRNASEALQPN